VQEIVHIELHRRMKCKLEEMLISQYFFIILVSCIGTFSNFEYGFSLIIAMSLLLTIIKIFLNFFLDLLVCFII
jgi:hypothetical protein